jgi:RNA exonuclease 1
MPISTAADEQHASQVAHTVVLFVPGLLPEHLGLPNVSPISILPFSTAPSTYTVDDSSPLSPCQVPAVGKMFSYGLPTRAPGDQRRMFSALTTLTSSPMPDSMRAKRDQENKRIACMSYCIQLECRTDDKLCRKSMAIHP